jgi:hypothetical protein
MFRKKTLPALVAGSLLLGAGILAFSPITYANPPHNPNLTAPYVGTPDLDKPGDVWRIRAFRDAHEDHASVPLGLENEDFMDICAFYIGTHYNPAGPTHDKYGWYTMSSPAVWWIYTANYGIATKEGDQVFMHGNNSYWNQYMQWELVSFDSGAGHWRAWHKTHIRVFNITIERIGEKCKPRYPKTPFFVLNVPNANATETGILHITNTGPVTIPVGALTASMYAKDPTPSSSGTPVFTSAVLSADLAPTETIRLSSADLEAIGGEWGGRAWMEIECNNCPPDAIKVQMTGKRSPGDPLVDLTPEVPEIREVDFDELDPDDDEGTFTLLGFPPTSSTQEANVRVYNTDGSSSYDVWGTLYNGFGAVLCSDVPLATIGPKNLVRVTNADVEIACGSWTDKNAWLQITTKAPAGIIRVQYLVRDNVNGPGTGVLSNISVGGQQ